VADDHDRLAAVLVGDALQRGGTARHDVFEGGAGQLCDRELLDAGQRAPRDPERRREPLGGLLGASERARVHEGHVASRQGGGELPGLRDAGGGEPPAVVRQPVRVVVAGLAVPDDEHGSGALEVAHAANLSAPSGRMAP